MTTTAIAKTGAKTSMLQEMTLTEIAMASYQELIDDFTPDEKKAFKQLEEHLTAHISGDLVQWWTFGAKVRDTVEAAEKDVKKYKANVVERFARALDFKSPHMVYTARRVAELWKTKTEFMEEVVNQGTDGYRLNWTHVCFISAVTSPAARRKIIKEAVAKKLTVEALKQFVAAQHPNAITVATNNRDGRPVRIPKSVPDALYRIVQISKQTNKLINQGWIGKKFDLFREFEATPPDLVTSELRDNVVKSLDEVTSLCDSVAALRRSLEKVKDEAEARLSRREAALVDSAADESDETPGAVVVQAEEAESMSDWKKRQKAKNAPKKKANKK